MTEPLPSDAASVPPAIELQHLSRVYGSFVALRDVSLRVPAGSSLMLLGPNGAGKSTLLKILAGLGSPSYGRALVFGLAPDAVRGRIAYMGHQTMLYDELTGKENLMYLTGLQRPSTGTARLLDEVQKELLRLELDPQNPRSVGEYSQGMRQRASLARVLLLEPDLLLLDEPFSNLDVLSISTMLLRLRSYLAEPGSEGRPRTLLFTTHQASAAASLASSTLTLKDGRIVPSLHGHDPGTVLPAFEEGITAP